MEKVNLEKLYTAGLKALEEGDLELAHVNAALLVISTMDLLDAVESHRTSILEVLDEDFPDMDEDKAQLAGYVASLRGFVDGRAEISTNDSNEHYLRGYKLGSKNY